MKSKTGAVIQARMSSTRLPGKVLKPLVGKPFLWHVINRLQFCETLDEIIVATTLSKKDDAIVEFCLSNGFQVFRGSENDVLERYFECAKTFDLENIVRITADDPFKDPLIIDTLVSLLIQEDLDFVCNNNPPSFPEGLDVEVLRFKTLKICQENAQTEFQREHVTQYIYQKISQFKVANFSNSTNLSHHRWTVDTIEDFQFATKIYDQLYREDDIFTTEEMFKFLNSNPNLTIINSNVERSTLYK